MVARQHKEVNNLPNPYKGMKPQDNGFRYTPKGVSSAPFNVDAKPFDPNGIYPNLLGHLHPGPEGNHIPTLELIKAK